MNICNCEECEKEYEDNIAELKARIVELETAQPWHAASEPPEHNGNYLVAFHTVHECFYDAQEKRWERDMGDHVEYEPVKQWRDLPPMPVKP
jgi:hypothetical protein